MAIKEKKRLGDILVESGKLSEEDLMMALTVQKTLGKKLGEVLVDGGMVSEDDIIDAIISQVNISRIDLNNVKYDKKAIKLVSQKLCKKYMLAPFGFEGDKIKVALVDPLNIFAIDDISISTGLEVIPYIASKAEILKYIDVNYSSEQVNKAAEELVKEAMDYKQAEENDDMMDNIKDAPVVKMIDQLFRNAVEMRTSDIHIEPYETELRIRYRIDGELQTINRLGIESLGPIITRIKILAGLDIAERRIPQDGKIVTTVGNDDVDLRVSILPVVTGEKVVIRILDRNNYKVGKDRLGLSPENLRKLENITSNPNGIMLVTGPTGSGKSTTLYTVLNELNSENVNVITIEDPVEYTLNGINQVNVNAKAGMTFASGLRSVLRQDPDVVMIGEIRDDETAQIATKAAITGHFVLSTLHTNDAPSSVARIIDMGIEPYLAATSIVGVVAQRLVRRNCEHCKQPYEATSYEKKVLGVNENEPLALYKGTGCGHCNNIGYKGRVGVYEIMEVGRPHREAIVNNVPLDELRDIAKANGMTTLADECKKYVLEGLTTVDELATIALLSDV